jgi:hypothetical protein
MDKDFGTIRITALRATSGRTCNFGRCTTTNVAVATV